MRKQTLPTQFKTERPLLRKHRLKLAPEMFAAVEGDRERLRQFLPWVDHARCELGYWILGRYEGQGYICEAVQGLESYLFAKGFNRIEIRCSSLNLRSAAVPRLGYVHEGTLRQECREQGKWRDTLIFAQLSQDVASSPRL